MGSESDNYTGMTIEGTSTPVSSWARQPGIPFDQDLRADLFRGPGAGQRVAGVQQALGQALERWWQQGTLPGSGLLRDGLYVLEGGHPLGEAERSLLLRAALFHGRGMVTALRHQTDPERTASVMRDMLLHPTQPLNPAQIRQLSEAAELSREWLFPLRRYLKEEASQLLEPRRTLAEAALAGLAPDAPPPPAWQPLSQQQRPTAAPIQRRRGGRGLRSPLALRLLSGLAVMLFVVSAISFWQYFQSSATARSQNLVIIPQGTYRVNPLTLGGETMRGERLLQVATFAMERTEVTNRAYQRCVDAGVCSLPRRTTSVTRPDYFLNPALGDYPMINVTWQQADAYCRWAGLRLPLAEEWQIAGGSAMTVEAVYAYPWGNTFDPRRANWVGSPPGDTLPVGSLSPTGDSPAGLAEMAGNVAEWTATPQGNGYLVLGGSFLSDEAGIRIHAAQAIPSQDAAPWIGFRCAVTLE